MTTKIYNFQKNTGYKSGKITALVSYYMLTILTFGLMLVFINFEDYYIRRCEYVFINGHKLHIAKDEISKTIDINKNINQLSSIDNEINYLVRNNKGFDIIIIINRYNKIIKIRRKNKIILTETLYLHF